MSNNCWAKSSQWDSSGNLTKLFLLKMVFDWVNSSFSSSSSRGMVQEDTMEADLKEALLELPELEAEDTEDTVDMVEMGDMVEARPLRELRPLSLLLWLWEVAWFPLLHMGCTEVTLGGAATMKPRGMQSSVELLFDETGGRLRLSRLFFHEPRPALLFCWDSADLGLRGCSSEGVLLLCRLVIFVISVLAGTQGSSKDDSRRPLADVRGFGGGAGGVTHWLLRAWAFCCCFLSFCTSSDVNCIVQVLPPRNFSQPGAPAKKYLLWKAQTLIRNWFLSYLWQQW